VRAEERRTLVALLIAGIVGFVLSLPAIYLFGLWLAPPRPVAEAAAAPGLLREALWARAEGGRATELTAVNPINFIHHRVCRALAARHDVAATRAERRAECLKQLPAIQGVDYLSGLHIREHSVAPGFREGITQFATAVWLTRSWTKDSLLDTMAARGEFGYGWRGVEAAARGYFGRSAAQLTLPQTALIASRIGDSRTDPWCEPEVAIAMRNRILASMRDNGAIPESDFREASTASLELAPPLEGRPPCRS
jgi:hypothetical protein